MEIVKKREEERQIEKLQKTALGRIASHPKESAALAQARRVAETKAQIQALEKRMKEKEKHRLKEQELEAAEDTKAVAVSKPGYLGVDMSEWVAAKPDDRPSELRGSKHSVQFTFTGTTGRTFRLLSDANGEIDEQSTESAKRKILPHLVRA